MKLFAKSTDIDPKGWSKLSCSEGCWALRRADDRDACRAWLDEHAIRHRAAVAETTADVKLFTGREHGNGYVLRERLPEAWLDEIRETGRFDYQELAWPDAPDAKHRDLIDDYDAAKVAKAMMSPMLASREREAMRARDEQRWRLLGFETPMPR